MIARSLFRRLLVAALILVTTAPVAVAQQTTERDLTAATLR